VLPQWKEQLAKVSEKAGQSLADPTEYKNLFPNFDKSLEAESVLAKERKRKMPASMFKEVPVRIF
jgi:coatomer subunit beta'